MTKRQQQIRQIVEGYNLVAQLGAMLVIPILVCLFCGIFLDRKLNTTPWLMLFLMIVGLVVSTYTVYNFALGLNKSRQHKEVDKA